MRQTFINTTDRKMWNRHVLQCVVIILFVLLVLNSDHLIAGDTPHNIVPQNISAIIEESCVHCHNSETSEGGLNFEKIDWDLNSQKLREKWILIHDRIEKKEMPPDADDLDKKDRSQLLGSLFKKLYQADYADVVSQGRGPMRRLNQGEYESNLRVLLKLPYLDIKDMLPGDRENDLFNKSTIALDISRIQLAAYIDAASVALKQAVASGIQPRKPVHHRLPATRMFAAGNTYGGPEAMFYAKDSQKIKVELIKIRLSKKHDPLIEMAIFRSPSWPYYGYPDKFKAVEAGNYKIRFSARAVLQVKGFRLKPATEPLPMTFRARKRSGPDVSGDVRATGGVIDIQPAVSTYETTIRLKKNETFEYSLLGLPVPRAINPKNAPLYYDFPPMPSAGHPGIAFQWLEVTGPIDSEKWPPPSHKILFGELPIESSKIGQLNIKLITDQPKKEASKLIHRFVKLASRQYISNNTIKVYEKLIHDELERGTPLAESLISGYTAFLCSGHFIYLREPMLTLDKNRVDQFAIASRLSHFLWNSRPDSILISHAKNKTLQNKKKLSDQVNRLIEDDHFDQFVNNFTDYWLLLKDIRRDEPDARLYPEYRFDDYLIESMESETRAFFKMMVRENLPVTTVVDSNFILVNDKLSRHYGLKPVTGSYLRKVNLPKASPYGGLLTQAAVLKVSANGSTTSPVIRGAWIMKRIMGDPPPPPPTNVPAVEPDIRGATTIRDQLAKHTNDKSCSACHARFDPVGFALENFDIMGAWRDSYRNLKKGKKVTGIDRAGHDYTYWIGTTVDASGHLRDGRSFKGITELKKHLLAEPRQLARNLLYLFTTYSTGTPVRFSDRPVIDNILDQCQIKGYRVRDLIHGLIQSRIFLGTKNQGKPVVLSQ